MIFANLEFDVIFGSLVSFKAKEKFTQNNLQKFNAL